MLPDLHGSVALHHIYGCRVFCESLRYPCSQSHNWTLSYVLLISFLLCFLCSSTSLVIPTEPPASSNKSHLESVHCGCCPWFGQNPDCGLGIQGQETGKNHEAVTGASNDVIPLCSLIQVILQSLARNLAPFPWR